MNHVQLIGTIVNAPVYYCTERGQDLVRFLLRTTHIGLSGRSSRQSHYCTAWGEQANELHRHGRAGDRLMVTGAIVYREREGITLPQIQVTDFGMLGSATQSRAAVKPLVHQPEDLLLTGLAAEPQQVYAGRKLPEGELGETGLQGLLEE